MSVGINIPTGPQLFYLVDSTTGRFSTPVKLEINPSTTDSISLTLTEPTAPIGLFELSGCSVSLTSVPGDGTPYSFTADSELSSTFNDSDRLEPTRSTCFPEVQPQNRFSLVLLVRAVNNPIHIMNNFL